MDPAPPAIDRAGTPSPQTKAERKRRFARETALITEADADIAAGRLIDEAEIDARINNVGTTDDLPTRRSRQ
jgi:hypothetical protein